MFGRRSPSVHPWYDTDWAPLVTGTIELADYALTIDEQARVTARISARIVTIRGSVTGSVTARETVDIRDTGSFDWVIIDTSPLLAVTDAVSLASAVSGVVFVLGAEMTHRRVAVQALDLIRTAKPGMISAVLNRVNFRRHQYYYGRYYGYQASYYGEPRQVAKETTASDAPANEISDAGRTALDHAIAELRDLPYRAWCEVVTDRSSFTKPCPEGPGRFDIDAAWRQGTRAIDVTVTLKQGWRGALSDGFTIAPPTERHQQSVAKVPLHSTAAL